MFRHLVPYLVQWTHPSLVDRGHNIQWATTAVYLKSNLPPILTEIDCPWGQEWAAVRCTVVRTGVKVGIVYRGSCCQCTRCKMGKLRKHIACNLHPLKLRQRLRVCVFFTINRSFSPSTSSTTSVRADSSILEDIQVIMWSQKLRHRGTTLPRMQ